MKHHLSFVLALLILVVTAAGAAAQKVPAVNLNVQIDDLASQSTYGIGSDGLGDYSNGVSSVRAQFTQYGFFDFMSGSRFVNAYYSTPIELTQNQLVPSNSSSGVTIKTHGGSNYLQNMAIGSSRCVQTTVNFVVGAYTRTIGYNAGYGTISNTGRVLISHPDQNTWVMESSSSGTCGSTDGNTYDNIARVRDHKASGRSAPDIDYGRYYMPMRIVLTRR